MTKNKRCYDGKCHSEKTWHCDKCPKKLYYRGILISTRDNVTVQGHGALNLNFFQDSAVI